MAIAQNYYDLSRPIVSAIRTADVITGEFLKPVSADSLAELRRLGLALRDQPVLSPCGYTIRCWLMSGSPVAPQRVAALLRNARGYGVLVEPDTVEESLRLTGPEMAFSVSAGAAVGSPV